MSIVTAADPTGRYIAGRGYPKDPLANLDRYPVVWEDGVPRAVDIPGIDQSVTDLISTGDGVAIGYDEQSWAGQAFRYSRGTVTGLPELGEVFRLAINERGDIAGTHHTPEGVRPFVVRAAGPSAAPVDLPLPVGTSHGEATDIDEDGTVVGFVGDATGADRAYRWTPEGAGRNLLVPAGTGKDSRALVVRGGWVAGWVAGNNPGEFLALRWQLSTRDVQAFPRLFTAAAGVNADGWLTGTDQQGRALLVAGDGDLSLPGLVEDIGMNSDRAEVLSDDGHTIAGQATDNANRLRAVVWRCE